MKRAKYRRGMSEAPTGGPTTADSAVKEVTDLFADHEKAWSDFRRNFESWMAFADGEQWPEDLRQFRENAPGGARPCLVLDKMGQYIRQIENDARKVKVGIKVTPAGFRSSQQVAEIYAAHIRQIEHVSDAPAAYDTAFSQSVHGGLGWARVLPTVVNAVSGAQEPRIKRIPNALSVLSDGDWVELDGCDIKSLFIFEDMPEAAFKHRYPKHEPIEFCVSAMPVGWRMDGDIRIAEHFLLTEQEIAMVILQNGQELPQAAYEAMYPSYDTGPEVHNTKRVSVPIVLWRKISGVEVLEESIIQVSYVPVVPFVGTEKYVKGKRILSGLVKPGMDAQRMYNYGRSSYAEGLNLAPKTPLLVAKGQIPEEDRGKWNAMNRIAYPYLEYNFVDAEGNQVGKPERQPPAMGSSGWAQDMQFSEHDIETSLGIFRSAVGAQGNERSAKAIQMRDQQSQTGTYHYIDNRNKSIRHIGKILVDFIKRNSDTKRHMGVRSIEGDVSYVYSDPTSVVPYRVGEFGGETRRIANMSSGSYEVSIDVGPGYASDAEAAIEDIMEFTRDNPQMKAVFGDIIAKLRGGPVSEIVMKRMRAMLPPQVIQAEMAEKEGKDVDPALFGMIQQLQQQLQQMQEEYAKMKEENTSLHIRLAGVRAGKNVEEYDAETRRIAAMQDFMSPEALKPLIMQVVTEALRTEIMPGSLQ